MNPTKRMIFAITLDEHYHIRALKSVTIHAGPSYSAFSK
jgi:hypothetical protein